MDSRHVDTDEKIAALEEALSGSAATMRLADLAKDATLALEFRESDAMIGLDPVAPNRIDRLRQLRDQALEKAALGGDVAAANALAVLVLKGSYEDGARVTKVLEQLETKDPTGDIAVKLSCFATRGISQSGPDVASAFRYAQLAAQKSNPDGLFEMSVLVSNGKGTEPNPEQGLRYCMEAADRGHVRAQFNAGYYYENGQGLPQSYEKAFHYYQKAADGGHPRGPALCAIYILLGRAGEVDEAKAAKLFAQSEAAGFFQWPDLAEALGIDPQVVDRCLAIVHA